MLAKILAGAGANTARPNPTFVSSSINRVTTAGNTVTAPTGIQNGDLIVAVGFASSATAITPPSGFNVLAYNSDSSNANTIFVATKTASSESGNYTWTWGGAANNTISMLVYRNATRVNTVGSVTTVTGSPLGEITASSITPTYAGTLVAAFFAESTNSVGSTPSGMTQRSSQTASQPTGYLYDLANQAASATGTKTLTWGGGGTYDRVALLFQVTNETNVLPEFVASASAQGTSGTTLAVNKPTGTVQGDLMIAVCNAATATGWTGDTGWTEVADQLSTNPFLRIAYKVAGASEGSSYTFTAAGSSAASKEVSILTYRYAAYDTIAGAFTTGANPLVLTSISPTLSQSLLLAVGSRGAGLVTLGTPTSMTARVTNADSTTPSYIICDQPVAKGPTGTRSMSTGSTTNVAGIMLAIKPTRSL